MPDHFPELALSEKIRHLPGPILVLGASGFVGANILRQIIAVRQDVVGTTSRLPAWRLHGLPEPAVRRVDLLIESNVDSLLADVQPQTVFNCVAYGAYSFETDVPLIYQTNFHFLTRLLPKLLERRVACFVHAGSSSEYGTNAGAPREDAFLAVNSHYAVSKAAACHLLYYYGQRLGLRCANLRLYSIFGPLEDASRLIPNVVRHGAEGRLPDFVDPNTSRDFVYIDDAVEAFVDTALNLTTESSGESFNIATGVCTTIADVANVAREVFEVADAPRFSMAGRAWDVSGWFGDARQAAEDLGWTPKSTFREGLQRTAEWYRQLPDREAYLLSSKKHGLDTVYSVSAVIACYKDNQAIPIMYERLKAVCTKINVDFEIIFVNDCSPDDTEEVIRRISLNDRRVVGISHSRNFGSQAAFVSGMRVSTKNACVLLDGDLQDPPELIEDFVAGWREGYDVVYGRRVKREAPFWMQIAYKAFYRIFDYFSYMKVPHDAGDFSLLDRKVVRAILQFPERDLFLRGVRAFAGFQQKGIDYVRPERMFGRSTNNLFKNIGWAKKGILSFSNAPLNMLSTVGTGLLILTLLLIVVQVILRLVRPELTPRGLTTVLLAVMFFGSLSVFGVGLLGEYLAKIFEEVKRRPLFIRRSVIRNGEVRPVAEFALRDVEVVQ